MTGNILMCALTSIRRKPVVSVALFVLATLAAAVLLLVLLAARYLALPDIASFGRFFSSFVIVAAAAAAAVLFSIGLFFAMSKRRAAAIFRIHGANKTDILFLNAVELLLLSLAGSLAGALFGMIAVSVGAFDIARILAGHRGAALFGAGGQIVFGVPLLEIATASAVTWRLLSADDGDLTRGAH